MTFQRWMLAALATVALQVGVQAAEPAPSPHGIKVPRGLKELTIPADNPLTAEKIELGKMLFFDTRLSVDNTVSCASCHNPKFGWSNGDAFATGVRGQKVAAALRLSSTRAISRFNSGMGAPGSWKGRHSGRSRTRSKWT